MERTPHPALAGLVRSVWLGASRVVPAPQREWMMPSGEMHLVLRLEGPPITVFDSPADAVPQDFGHAVVNGARAGMYAKSHAGGSSSIGLQLLPGASLALLGLPADELAGRHVRLADIWGADAGLLREALLATPSEAGKLACLEAAVIKRLLASPRRTSPWPHAAVLTGLQLLRSGSSVEGAARSVGYSQRQFVRLFSQAVGLTPRLYLRVRRFQRALHLLHGRQQASLAGVAFDAGYTDQPHFNRDFRAFSGLTPEQYRAAGPVAANHVPVSGAAGGDVRFIQDRRRQAA